jgi:anti-sigma regulatory factor (Ser/Thr protein kinase)
VTATATTGPAAGTAQFDHRALLYRGADEYLAATTGFVRSALTGYDAVLVAVPGPRLDALRESLADVAGQVVFTDMAIAGRNPGRIIPKVLLGFAAEHPGRRVSIVGEPIRPGSTTVEYPACATHEALINTVFAGHDATILCPYDAGDLDEAAVDDAWRTHPVMIAGGARRPSDRYTDPLVAAASFNQPLPPAPDHAPGLAYFGAGELSLVRRFVVEHATAAGLTGDRLDDLVVAVNELAGNTVEHTSGPGRVSLWREDGHVVCQVSDAGHLTDPLAGRLPARPQAHGGQGLLLANYLCDLFRLHTGRDGTTIRLHLHL